MLIKNNLSNYLWSLCFIYFFEGSLFYINFVCLYFAQFCVFMFCTSNTIG